MHRQPRLTSSVRRRLASIVAYIGAIGGFFVFTAVVFAETPTKQKVIVDFEDAKAVKLIPMQAMMTPSQLDGRQALQIVTARSALWPGVLIEPSAGHWDLSGFDGLEMNVFNPQEASVRVLLSVSNPGADGANGCNTASVIVPQRGKATLTLPFGTWHGETDHPIDLKNIVSIQVLLDRPSHSQRFVVGDICAVRFDGDSMKEVFADPFFERLEPPFGRGVNLGNALESPNEGDWGVVLKTEYFDQIKSAGFDSVRIPVCWSAHAETSFPYRIDPKFLARVDWAINQALQRRLAVVMDMHNYDGISRKPDKHWERFLAIWRQLAEHYKDYPPTLAFELLNEPCGNLTADKWNRLLAETIAIVRRTNPTREIVVGPVNWNNVNELQSLQLPQNDRRLVVTVHYYTPFQFTHQGTSWNGPESQKWLGTTWTGTPAEQKSIVRELDAAAAWAVNNRRPLYLGEFGAFNKADLESRARWTQFVAEEAMKRKIGFAYWEFCSVFGIYDLERGQWIEPLKNALLPPGR